MADDDKMPGAPDANPPAASAGGALSLPSLAPPTGGGALRGIDAKFQTNPSTGTAAMAVPIFTSPGRAGFQLGLSLGYDSGAGNGVFGVGWQLSAASITRRTDKRLPRYLDGEGDQGDSDVFLSGNEDLVPVRDAQGRIEERREGEHRIRRYRPRVEGAFARIERWTHASTGDVHWVAATGDGVISFFGRSGRARVVDPEDPRRVFSWLLEESRDDRGSIVRYEYKQEDGAGVDRTRASEAHRFGPEGGFRAVAQRYLKRISYGNGRPHEASGWLFEVVLDYGEHPGDAPAPEETRAWGVRRDPFSSHRSGFEIRTYRLCRRVLMFHRFPELGPEPCLVRSTDFEYEHRDHLTRLTRVVHAGYQRTEHGSTRATLPATEFAYSSREVHQQVCAVERGSLDGIPAGVDGRTAQWVDLNGEGVAGVLLGNDRGWLYKANDGEGRLGPPELLPTLPVPAELRGGYQQLTDIDGSGQLALVRYSPPLAGHFSRTAEGGWTAFLPFEQVPNIDWTSRDLRFLDLDGDGKVDVLITQDDALIWYRSNASRGFEGPAMVTRARDEAEGPALIFADATEAILLADMCGDGLLDIVRVRNGEICYWPNLGFGRFGRKVVLDGSPQLAPPHLFDPARVRLADIDGSGTADILYLGHEGICLYFNESGNRLTAPERLSLPIPHAMATVSILDLLGHGTMCLVWSSIDPADGAHPVSYVDLMGGKKPHLLERFANGMGAETEIEYRASTAFYLRDKAEGRPWITRLPFPVQVVARVERRDAVSRTRLVTRYRYHHGFYDGVEREYRGFALVEQWDAESFEGGAHHLVRPPVLTRTWFHTGVWLDRARFQEALSRDFWAGDPEAGPPLETHLPEGLSEDERREAARALRGRVSRQEVFAEDLTAERANPYFVVERSYQLRVLQRVHREEHGAYFVHDREELRRTYERRPHDPRTAQTLTLDVDPFGNVIRSASLAYPRRNPSEPEQAKLFATLTESSFDNHAARDGYRLAIPIESRTSELTGLPAGAVLSPEELRALLEWAHEIPFEAAPAPGRLERRLLTNVRYTYYLDDLSGPRPAGEGGARALPYQISKRAFTPGLLSSVLGRRLETSVLLEGGYRFELGGWWAPSSRLIFEPEAFFQPTAAVDPFGNRSFVRLDRYSLLVVETEDALGNKMTAGHRDEQEASVYDGNDYRVLTARLFTDANRNRTAVAFDALGMPERIAVMGKAGEGEGDTLEDPTRRFEYDLHRFAGSGGKQPISCRALAREEHGADNPRWQESYSYVDGSGREIMRKVQAPPSSSGAPRWVGTGRTVFDNKGNPVEKYEPFFSDTFEYEDERALVESGVTPILRYDPLGRLVRTDLPDGTFRRVTFDSWTSVTWDECDAVLESAWFRERGSPDPEGPEPRGDRARRAAWLSAQHAGTPGRAWLDPLGRTFLTEEDNRQPGGPYRTRLERDISGNIVRVVDARGNATLERQVFDMLGRRIFARFHDAGERRVLHDIGGNPLRSWDGRGHAMRYRYDALRRGTHQLVRGPQEAGEALVVLTVFGESHPEASARNLRTRSYRVYDGAGALTNARYDFKGNLVDERRRLAISDQAAQDWISLDGMDDPSAVSRAARQLLEEEGFATTTRYDALNRMISRTTADGSETRRHYDLGNRLARLEVRLRGAPEWTPFVTAIDYNARGQRTRAVHGNGAIAHYDYDPRTFRLIGIRTSRPHGGLLQDLSYVYDAVGNVVQVGDAVAYGNPDVSADGLYTYDALYRLISAEGREHPGQLPTFEDARDGVFVHHNDVHALHRYREGYAYDAVGNIETVTHRTEAGRGHWVRRYRYESDGNRLSRTTGPDPDAPQDRETYTYDPSGNTASMPHLPEMQWDYADRWIFAERRGGGRVHFVYTAGGQRARKVYQHQGWIEERIYLGELEVHRKRRSGSKEAYFERQTLHVMDDKRRVALVETKMVDEGQPVGSPAPRSRFQLENHLASSIFELDESAAVISYEEYSPYGTQSFYLREGRAEVGAKRYRYMGRERDEETGLYSWGVRYYAPWLGRWSSFDPRGLGDGTNGYEFLHGNPVNLFDPDGGSWGSFFRGLATGVAVAVVVVAVVATAPISIPASVAVGATVVGVGVTGYTVVQSARQRDVFNRPISRDQADEQLGGAVGGLLVGGVSSLSGPGAAGASSLSSSSSEFFSAGFTPALADGVTDIAAPVLAPAVSDVVTPVASPALAGQATAVWTSAATPAMMSMAHGGGDGGGSSSSSSSSSSSGGPPPDQPPPEEPVCREDTPGPRSVDPEGEPFEDPAPPNYEYPQRPVTDHILNRARGGDPVDPANLDTKTWEANSRKAGFEGNYTRDLQRYIDQGLSPQEAEYVLQGEADYIVNDVHARPVDPFALDELPNQSIAEPNASFEVDPSTSDPNVCR